MNQYDARPWLELYSPHVAPLLTPDYPDALSLFQELERQGMGSRELAYLLGLVASGHLKPEVAMQESWQAMGTMLAALGERRVAGKAVAFLDTCHSGNIFGSGRKGLNDITGVINELASAENGVVVFSSSTGRQSSLEDASWNNGAFTKALVEGIDGKADEMHTGRVTYKMLDLYVAERVKALTKGKQSPVTQAPGGVNDFPLASVK